jgi:hypothetical protein
LAGRDVGCLTHGGYDCGVGGTDWGQPGHGKTDPERFRPAGGQLAADGYGVQGPLWDKRLRGRLWFLVWDCSGVGRVWPSVLAEQAGGQGGNDVRIPYMEGAGLKSRVRLGAPVSPE